MESSLLPTSQDAVVFLNHLQDQVPIFLHGVERALLERYNLDTSGYTPDHVCWRTETEEEYTSLVNSLKKLQLPISMDSDSQGTHLPVVTLLTESLVGGRHISTFYISKGFSCLRRVLTKNGNDTISDIHTIHILEIPSPKLGSPYPKGLEHVEFVIPCHHQSTNTNISHHDAMPYPESKEIIPLSNIDLTPRNDTHHQIAFQKLMNQHPQIPWNTKAMHKELNPDISFQLDLSSELSKDVRLCSVKFHLIPLEKVIDYEKREINYI